MLFGVILCTVLMWMVWAASVHGHKTGMVQGSCPAYETDHPDSFFKKPERNDLGCCTWTAKEGTCCKQSACDAKGYTYDFDVSDACNDLMGLLSCSVCHVDAGMYAGGFGNVTVCDEFCEQLYLSCDGSSSSTDYRSFCQDMVKVHVARPGVESPMCFGAGSSLRSHTSVLLPLLLAAAAAYWRW